MGTTENNIKQIDGVFQVEKDAVQATTDAVEFFLKDIFRHCMKKAKALNKTCLDADIILQVVEDEEQYDFLRNVTPHDEQTKSRKRKRKRKQKLPISSAAGKDEESQSSTANQTSNTEFISVSNTKYELAGDFKMNESKMKNDDDIRNDSDDFDFDSS